MAKELVVLWVNKITNLIWAVNILLNLHQTLFKQFCCELILCVFQKTGLAVSKRVYLSYLIAVLLLAISVLHLVTELCLGVKFSVDPAEASVFIRVYTSGQRLAISLNFRVSLSEDLLVFVEEPLFTIWA